jgi:hypothetical protein
MGKYRQIFVWNGKEDLGPFRREELIEQLRAGTVLPSDYYIEQEMPGWERVACLPCCSKLLATDAQREMLDRLGVAYGEFLTKADVSSILENQPATERQLDYLRSFGIAPAAGLSKIEASQTIEQCLADPVARERQSRIQADEFENKQREREAFPSYWLKQDTAAAQRDVEAVKREWHEKKAELSQLRSDQVDIRRRQKSVSDEIEREALVQQIASIEGLIESLEIEINDQRNELKEAKNELRHRQSLRKKFWMATFTQLGADREDDENLIDYCEVIDRLYDFYGRAFKAPTFKHIDDILEVLDSGSSDWDKQEPQAFFVKCKSILGA